MTALEGARTNDGFVDDMMRGSGLANDSSKAVSEVMAMKK